MPTWRPTIGRRPGSSSSCSTPRRRSPGGTAEVVQARIQQVQQAAARLRKLRRFVDDSLSNMADGVLVSGPEADFIDEMRGRRGFGTN